MEEGIIQMVLKRLRRPLAVFVIAALLVSGQGLALDALAQAVSTPKTGKSAPVAIPAAQSFSGLGVQASPSASYVPGVFLTGSVVSLPAPGVSGAGVPLRSERESGLPAAPEIALDRGEPAIPVLEAPAALSPVLVAAPEVSDSARSLIGTPAAEDSPVSQPAADGIATQSAAPKSELSGLRKLTHGISKVGAAFSLRRFFDGGRAPAEGDASLGAARTEPDLGRVKVFLTRHGADPVETDLKSLSGLLASDPRYLTDLNKEGRVRLVVGEGAGAGTLTRADEAFIRRTVESYGVTARVDVEKLSVSAPKKAAEVEALKTRQGASSIWRKVLSLVTAPAREIVYLIKTLKDSFTRPSAVETFGGLASKAVPFIMGLSWWWKTFMPAHPAAWAIAVGYSLALNVFHGVFIDTWNTFQNRIGKQRGLQYQTGFNFLYGQIPGMIFRFMVWAVIANTIPPWALAYWRDIGIATIIGTLCGTLGYQGLNGLYDKGIISRGWRSGFQQVRDLFFCLGGIFFGTGSMAYFWPIFFVQQGLDVLLYVVSRRMAKRSIAYVADEQLASTSEFQGMYPVKPGPEESPLKAALKAVLEFLPIKLAISLVKYLIGLFKKKSPPAS
ncbi:MAG: hypothetical protein HY748_03710 [Elusimicrobia bacterium]|nr:hypothetical protein [Elusimicrobiota bacterium]